MAMIRYSQKLHGFFPYDLNYKDLPDDIIDIPIEEYNKAMKRKPGERYKVEDGKVIIIPVPTLTFEQKTYDKLEEIRVKARECRHGGSKVMLDGKEQWIFTDESIRVRLMMFLNHWADQTYKIETCENQTIELTAALCHELIAKIYEHDQLILSIAQGHRDKLALQTEPEKYDMKAGWPQTYIQFFNSTRAW